jgi:hypothetical protein
MPRDIEQGARIAQARAGRFAEPEKTESREPLAAAILSWQLDGNGLIMAARIAATLQPEPTAPQGGLTEWISIAIYHFEVLLKCRPSSNRPCKS